MVASNVRINITAATAHDDVVISNVQSGGVVGTTEDSKKQVST